MSRYSLFGDWGTTRLRLFRMENGVPVARQDGAGIGRLSAAVPQALAEVAGPLIDAATPPDAIILCGMVGAQMGWREVPYLDCPVDAALWRLNGVDIQFLGTTVTIAPGLACADADCIPDVMRGEETQIFGALALVTDLARGDRLIVLPGTHSKWARISEGRVTGFRTIPTGEMFALLAEQSTLVGATTGTTAPCEAQDGFRAGLAAAEGERGVLGGLFAARSMQLRAGRSADWARHYLSGLLIGSEVREMTRDMAAEIVLIGASALTALYREALAGRGLEAIELDGDACALAGLALLGDAR